MAEAKRQPISRGRLLKLALTGSTALNSRGHGVPSVSPAALAVLDPAMWRAGGCDWRSRATTTQIDKKALLQMFPWISMFGMGKP